MKLFGKAAVGFLSGFLFYSCHSISPEKLGGEWELRQLDGMSVESTDVTPYIGFEGSRIYGFTGCNRLALQVSDETLANGRVDFSQVSVTMMNCPDARYESAFLAAMAEVKKLRTKGGSLQLLDEQGKVRLEFAERKLTRQLLEGEWNVVEIQGMSVAQDDGNAPFLGFDTKEQRVYGFTGCNRLTGTFHLEQVLKGEVDFSAAAMTRMLCAEDKYESKFMSALSKARKLSYRNGFMMLLDGEGHPLIKLRR